MNLNLTLKIDEVQLWAIAHQMMKYDPATLTKMQVAILIRSVWRSYLDETVKDYRKALATRRRYHESSHDSPFSTSW